MSWRPAAQAARLYASAAITTSLVRSGGPCAGRRLLVVLRSPVIDLVPFLDGYGLLCTVRIGEGVHAGKIRIERGATHPMARRHFRGEERVEISLAAPAGVVGCFKKTRCEFLCGADWIEIELPDWCVPRGPELAGARIAAVSYVERRVA